MIKIIAHRGDTSKYPENTIEAFLAAEAAGADGIELDVRETADGVLVVHHDYYLGNPDNGSGSVPYLPYSAINNLTIENRYYIPKLEAVFDKIGKKLHYEIELKCLTLDAAEKVITLANKFDVLSSIEFTSPHPYLLPSLKKRHRLIKTGFFVPPRPEWMDEELYIDIHLNQALLGNYNVIHMQPQYITKDTLQRFHNAGLVVHAADCDDPEVLLRMKALGVDQLTTNKLADALA
jgi:glycerophosphoryl diester phosphodiesterase